MGVPEGSNPKVEKPRAQDVSSIQLILCVSPPTGLACLLQAYWADRVSFFQYFCGVHKDSAYF